jgi:hypothetical protein
MTLPVFYEKVTGIDNSEYDDTHMYKFGFMSGTVQLNFRSGTGPIQYSFNGSVDHGEIGIDPGLIQTQILEPYRAHRIWLKGGDGTEIVEITALPQN